jgi:hypothetical protein
MKSEGFTFIPYLLLLPLFNPKELGESEDVKFAPFYLSLLPIKFTPVCELLKLGKFEVDDSKLLLF